MSFRIGVSTWAESRTGIEQVGAAAVAGGIDTFWLGDGLLSRADFPPWSGGMEPFTELSWLAGRFPGVAVALGAAVLPLRDPVWVAKQAASLDQLTEGRFTLVVTPGNWPDEFEAAGKDFSGRGTAFDSGIRTIRDIWADSSADRGPSPHPFTPGGPPLWLAGAGATLRRALRLGLPFQISRTGPAALAPVAKKWFDEGGTTLAVRVRLGLADRSHINTEDGSILGPPAFLADQVDAYRQLGVGDLSVMPGQDAQTALETISALVEHVLPALGS
jgi:alkanesulfonate monooxygenase SsuD/methylene tetrahydromethanopterin reductase-like flavin-dependent oxidoreductase (luciferase family)